MDNIGTSFWRRPGGGAEVLRLALPLIVANGFMTLQVTIDRVMLSWLSSESVAAAMPAVMIFWTPLALLQGTANYATTFVAQYSGAGRPHRVGPAVWQSIYFSLGTGLLFLGLVPWAETLMAWTDHSPRLQELEAIYFRCLCFAALPTLLIAATSSFFAGRGDSWTVLLINAVGTVVNAVLDYLLIFGYHGFPAWGIAGAGWATAAGSCASAIVGVALFLRARYRQEFATLRGWRFEPALFLRLMRFGLPSGMQWFLEGVAFTLFVLLVGRLGEAPLAATSIAVTLNMLAFLPTMGIGQAVSILVGQRLGENRPEMAERSTWTGVRQAWLFMTAVALLYVLAPGFLLGFFKGESVPSEALAAASATGLLSGVTPYGPLAAAARVHSSQHGAQLWSEVAVLVPMLLRFVALYCLFDSLNIVFSFALKGAGDTRFVTLASLLLSWPLMVVPTWYIAQANMDVGWAWAFATLYVIVLSLTFLARFWQGKWKSMRVIEPAPLPDADATLGQPGTLAPGGASNH